MSNLHNKLKSEAEHIKLSHAEKAAMRAAIFGAPSPLTLRAPQRSSFALFGSTWARALAALVLVVGAGTGTAFASQGALPGQPLYAIKTNVVEPVALALATTPAAKATVHAQIAQARVAEAEALAQNGTLDATTSAQLADNFESNAQSAVALADQASTTDPAAAVQVKAQLAVSSSVGSAILSALAEREGRGHDHTAALAARVLAVATRSDQGDSGQHGAGVRTMALAKTAGVRTMAATTNSEGSGEGSGTSTIAEAPAAATVTAAATFEQGKAAQGIAQKAHDALGNLKAQFAAASSTLDASTTVNVQTSIAGIDSLMVSGNQALNDSIYDTAAQDFTQALGRALRLSALLDAQQHVDRRVIDPLIKQDSSDNDTNDSIRAGLKL